jgi:hypothetical protein
MNYENYVVHITVQKNDIDLNHPLNKFSNSQISGTGFFIEYGLILTCYHVVQNSLDIMVTVINNIEKKKIKAKLKYIFPDDDLAVIELQEEYTYFKIFEYYVVTNKEINFEVNTIGYPLNSTTLKINKGILSGFQDSNIQTDSTLNSGNSGGPLLYNGKVIGINQSRLIGNASNTGFAIPIFRFLILFKLKPQNLKLINHKPDLLFNFQKNLQKIYGYSYGVRISEINKYSILNNYDIKVNDLLLKINNNKVDNEGNILFNFFPEKINIRDLYLWFTNGDKLLLTIYSNNKIINKEIEINYKETNLINYIYESDKQYNFEYNGLIFSIFTNYHIEEIKNLNMRLSKKVKLLSRFSNIDSKFTLYLSDVDYVKLKFTEYPINEIITHINNIEIIDYDTLINIFKTEINSFITINNEIYYI